MSAGRRLSSPRSWLYLPGPALIDFGFAVAYGLAVNGEEWTEPLRSRFCLSDIMIRIASLSLFALILGFAQLANAVPFVTIPERPQLEIGEVLEFPVEPRLTMALELLKSKKLDEAIALLRAFVTDIPGSAPGHELLGAALVLSGRTDEGLHELQQSVKVDLKQSSAYTKIGDVHLLLGDAIAAMAAFRQAIAIAPNDRLAHQRIGLLLDEQHQVREAITHYELGLQGAPSDYLGIKLDLARLYVQTGHSSKAVSLIERLVPDSLQSAPAHLTLGHAYLTEQALDQAIHQYELAVKLDPNMTDALLALGGSYRQKGLHAQSVATLNQFVAAKSDQPTGYYQLAETYLAMKAYDNALAQFEKAKSISKNPQFVLRRMADVYLQQNQMEKAIPIYKSLAEAKDATAREYDSLGSAYQKNLQLAEAEHTFRRMAEQFSADPFAHYRLGLFYGYVRKSDRAVAELERALTLKPNDPVILKALSNAYHQRGDFTNAARTAEQLAAMLPNDMEQKAYLAVMYDAVGRRSEAETLYRAVLTSNPKHLLALNNLAALMTQEGKLNQALALGEQAVAIAPADPHVLDTLAWTHHKLGHHAEALKLLGGVESLASDSPTMLYHLGAVHAAMDHPAEARQFLKKALALSVKFPGAHDARALQKALAGR